MWIKTDYDELINTDRLSLIKYDRILNRTFAYDNDTRVIVADFDATTIIMNGLMRGSKIVEVK